MVITRSIRSEPSSTGATQSSSRMSILACGANLLSANNDGVASTVSPIERNRTTRILRTDDQSHRAGARGCGSFCTYPLDVRRATLGDDSMICRRLFIWLLGTQASSVLRSEDEHVRGVPTRISFILDLCFLDQHHRNVITNWIDALARDAFQPARSEERRVGKECRSR